MLPQGLHFHCDRVKKPTSLEKGSNHCDFKRTMVLGWEVSLEDGALRRNTVVNEQESGWDFFIPETAAGEEAGRKGNRTPHPPTQRTYPPPHTPQLLQAAPASAHSTFLCILIAITSYTLQLSSALRTYSTEVIHEPASKLGLGQHWPCLIPPHHCAYSAQLTWLPPSTSSCRKNPNNLEHRV